MFLPPPPHCQGLLRCIIFYHYTSINIFSLSLKSLYFSSIAFSLHDIRRPPPLLVGLGVSLTSCPHYRTRLC